MRASLVERPPRVVAVEIIGIGLRLRELRDTALALVRSEGVGPLE